MEKKTVIITGANSGLGFACAEFIAKQQEYRLILACRDAEKSQKAKEKLTETTGNHDIISIPLDLASQKSVHHFVEQYKTMEMPPLYGLICNAGISGGHTGKTVDHMDCIFETNHLGHFLLSMLLLPEMQKNGRILVVSSDMHCPPAGELTWIGVEKLAYPDEEFGQQLMRYSYSKLCNLYFVYELSKRLQEQNSQIVINAFNPGLMTDTNFMPNKANFTPELLAAVADRVGSLADSAKALAALMTEPAYGVVTGKYFDRSTNTCNSSPLSYDKQNALELWEKSSVYTNLSTANVL